MLRRCGPLRLGDLAEHLRIAPRSATEVAEVRVRVVGRTGTMAEAVRIGNEVESLYTNGPAGGGGAWKSAREVVAVVSTLIPRDWVKPAVHYEVA